VKVDVDRRRRGDLAKKLARRRCKVDRRRQEAKRESRITKGEDMEIAENNTGIVTPSRANSNPSTSGQPWQDDNALAQAIKEIDLNGQGEMQIDRESNYEREIPIGTPSMDLDE